MALRSAMEGKLNKDVPSMSKMTYSIFGLDAFAVCAMLFEHFGYKAYAARWRSRETTSSMKLKSKESSEVLIAHKTPAGPP